MWTILWLCIGMANRTGYITVHMLYTCDSAILWYERDRYIYVIQSLWIISPDVHTVCSKSQMFYGGYGYSNWIIC